MSSTHSGVTTSNTQNKPTSKKLACRILSHTLCITYGYFFLSLRSISKIGKYLTQDSAQILIHAFISSKLDYCNSLLYGIPKYLVCRLQRVQNTAARIVTLTRKYDSITPIMFKLHWLPVHSRIIFKLLLLVYKALNGKAPSYISSLLSHRKCSRSLRSSGQELLTVPLAKLKTYGDRAFSIAAPRQWNNLPLSIRKSPSIAILKDI